jgi:hypothetical protein
MVQIPEKFLPTTRSWFDKRASLTINKQALGRIVAALKGEFVFISEQGKIPEPSFIAHSGDHFKP